MASKAKGIFYAEEDKNVLAGHPRSCRAARQQPGGLFFCDEDYLHYKTLLGEGLNRYIELNPVAAGMVNNPGQYPWSSYRANPCCEHDALIDPHPVYQRLGQSSEEQSTVYRHLFEIALRAADICDIRQGIERNYSVGSHRFRMEIEEALSRKRGTGKRGRPLKARQVDQ